MPQWVDIAFDDYTKRMPREARINLIEIKPEKREGGKTTEQVLSTEATRILTALPEKSKVIVLDERGSPISTKDLSQWLKDFMRDGDDVSFIIGSADGLHTSIKQRAHRTLALSALTLPHGFARVLLSEQIYRAISIIQNHPYHRE